MREHEPYGAQIERGIIKDAGDGVYTVESRDRDGVITPPLAPVDNTEYTAGDRVYFFLFEDGTGKILYPMA